MWYLYKIQPSTKWIFLYQSRKLVMADIEIIQKACHFKSYALKKKKKKYSK